MAEITKVKKYHTEDHNLRAFQDSVDKAVSEISAKFILNGNLVKDISIVTGTPKTIEHKLGREYIGWLAVKRSSGALLWQSTSTVPGTLVLNASANVSVDLWVF